MKRDGFAPSFQVYWRSVRFAYGGRPFTIWLYVSGGSLYYWLVFRAASFIRLSSAVILVWLLVSAVVYMGGIDRQAYSDAKESLSVSKELSDSFDALYPRIRHPERDLNDSDILWLARANDGLHQIQSTIVVTRIGLVFALLAGSIVDPHGIHVFLLWLAFGAAEAVLQAYHEMLVRRRYRLLLLEWVDEKMS